MAAGSRAMDQREKETPFELRSQKAGQFYNRSQQAALQRVRKPRAFYMLRILIVTMLELELRKAGRLN